MKFVPVSIVILVRRPTNTHFELWMQKRQAPGTLNGLLEFPGGKIETDETPIIAARREILEETGFDLSKTPLVRFKLEQYDFEGRHIYLNVFLGTLDEMHSKYHQGNWFEIKYTVQSRSFEGKIPPINHKIIDEVGLYIEKQFKAGTWDLIWRE